MRSLIAILTILSVTASANSGDYCHRSRTLYYADTYTYHPAGWHQGRWYPAGNYAWINNGWHLQGYGYHAGYAYPTYEKVKVIYKEVEPDYYASVRDHYRDSLFADAVAFRVMMAQKTSSLPQQPAQLLPNYGSDKESPARMRSNGAAVRTPVSPVLTKYVAENCLKCHNGPAGKGNVDLSSLETVPVGIRWACHGTVSAGEMPKGGPEAPDEAVKLFYEWSRAAAKKE